jgi:hypothetical protein
MPKYASDFSSAEDLSLMAEPAAIWGEKLIVWDNSLSKIHNILLGQASDALRALVRHIDRVHEAIDGRQFESIVNDHTLPSLLSDICNQHAVACTILFDGVKRSKENATLTTIRNERISLVKQRCQGLNLRLLPDKKFRNTLIHIDEYLAKALRAHNTGWAVDCVFTDRVSFLATLENPRGVEPAFCRCYAADEDLILHVGYQIHLGSLREEARAVLCAVFGLDPGEHPRGRKRPAITADP